MLNFFLKRWSQFGLFTFSFQNRGFPSTFLSKQDLAAALLRIIWLNTAQHSAVNNPLADFGIFTPHNPQLLLRQPMQWFPSEINAGNTGNLSAFLPLLPPLRAAVVSFQCLDLIVEQTVGALMISRGSGCNCTQDVFTSICNLL